MKTKKPIEVKWLSLANLGGLSVTWCKVGDKPSQSKFKAPVIAMCQFCNKFAVVKMPAELIAIQPDDTNHVCHPILGGCNQGYSLAK